MRKEALRIEFTGFMSGGIDFQLHYILSAKLTGVDPEVKVAKTDPEVAVVLRRGGIAVGLSDPGVIVRGIETKAF